MMTKGPEFSEEGGRNEGEKFWLSLKKWDYSM